ncbi:ADP-ribosylation factor-like protein 6-interacting protein 1 isoform X1 [Helicoverpa armigera]|uniref:ADP-ribosylation factor-like protein 6-interacting protein 1 isoform X1 n=1 Tax=Helicoverpa armigera TaxID=29058 RepID=UPI003083964B
MAEYTISQNQQEQQVKKLKRFLEGSRMAILPLKSVILWEQQWHPCAIVGSVSILYFLIWLMDLNSLATFAVVGLFLNFVDFIVPVICNSLYGPTSWTGQHEKMYEEVCKSIVANYNKGLQNVRLFYSLRETSPCMYYILSISMLVTLGWVASSINNTFLLYILSTVMLLWPGVRQRGIFNTLLSMVNMAPKSVKSE